MTVIFGSNAAKGVQVAITDIPTGTTGTTVALGNDSRIVASAQLGTLGQAQVTANQTSLGAGPTDLTSMTSTVTVGSGRRIKISACCALTAGTLLADCTLSINESTTVLQSGTEHAVAAGTVTLNIFTYLTPSVGSHTYKLTASFSANANNLLTASSTQPATLIIEDVGT